MSFFQRLARSLHLSQKKGNDARKLKPALFLHIQKTAGTTIVDLAWKHYGYSVCSHGNFESKQADDLADLSFISGHFGYEFAKPLMGSRYSFTFLREPEERILSFYYFCRTRNPEEREIYQLAQSMDLESFLQAGFENPLVKSLIWNSQVWRLACGYPNELGRGIDDFTSVELLHLAKTHLSKFSYVGFTETFEEDRDVILTALAMPLPRRQVISNANLGRPTRKEIPQHCQQLLNELTVLDRQLFNDAWSNRHVRVKDR